MGFLGSLGSGTVYSLESTCAAAAAVGVLSHVLYFIRRFREREGLAIICVNLAAGTAVYLKSAQTYGIVSGVAFACLVNFSYLCALSSSIIIYRLFFHRLRHFPGPIAAKITGFYGPYRARNWKIHIEDTKLLEKYGDFVRVGPNALLVRSPEALAKVHGAHSRCTKQCVGTYEYLVSWSHRGLLGLLGREEHKNRSRVWEGALSNIAINDYEGLTVNTIKVWLGIVAMSNGRPMNTSLYAQLFAFHNIGLLGFSKDFGCMRKGKQNAIMELLSAWFEPVAALGHMTWPIPIIMSLGVDKDNEKISILGRDLIEERDKKQNLKFKDICSYFFDDLYSDNPINFSNRKSLFVEAQTLLTGGTDTVGASLGYTMYYLAKYPRVRRKLQNGLSTVHGKSVPGEFTHADLRTIGYLDAVINESLRMDSPAGNNASRMTPPEGIVINGTVIPGDIAVYVGIYSASHSEKFFVKPYEFIPERWDSQSELIIERRGFFPFNGGRWSCVGQKLAMMTMRMFLAYTLWNCDFDFAAGEDGVAVHRDAKNVLIVRPGKLELVFHTR